MRHTRLRTTILHSEGRDCKRYFERPDGGPWEAAQTALQGSRWVRQFERKEEMRPINWTFLVFRATDDLKETLASYKRRLVEVPLRSGHRRTLACGRPTFTYRVRLACLQDRGRETGFRSIGPPTARAKSVHCRGRTDWVNSFRLTRHPFPIGLLIGISIG